MARCPVCSASHASCGPATTVVGIDERVTLRREGTVGDLKKYSVAIPGRHGRTTTTTLLLSDEDATTQGLLKTKQPKAAVPPQNKAVDSKPNK